MDGLVIESISLLTLLEVGEVPHYEQLKTGDILLDFPGVEKLRAETDYTEGSCISRTGHARSIINAGRAEAALNIIISSDSPRVSEKTRKDALQWIQKIIS